MSSSEHKFGGPWTGQKLAVLKKYLAAYTTALKNTSFKKIYVDAFAGSGQIVSQGRSKWEYVEDLFNVKDEDAGPMEILKGSASIALEAQPAFDQYVFIEKNQARCQELEKLAEDYPAQAVGVQVIHGEANEELCRLCAHDWSSQRAVLFLDPYGMQVEWRTIRSVANTKAIDMWLLFPLGMAVNRLITRNASIPSGWETRLNLFFGTPNWKEEFYELVEQDDLFGRSVEYSKKPIERIGQYFNDRLAGEFADVLPSPGILRNNSGHPLFLLCFAAGNAKGAPIALRIAKHLVKEIQ